MRFVESGFHGGCIDLARIRGERLVMADDLPSPPDLEPREPTVQDLRDLCRELNKRGALYVVAGGFAI